MNYKQLAQGEISRVRRFWETEPSAVIWRYGNELKDASPDRAMEIWEEMIQKGLPVDITAKNLYIAALKTRFCPIKVLYKLIILLSYCITI